MNFSEKILEAQALENSGELQQAWETYIQIISSAQLKEKHGEAYFAFALFLFRNQCYDEALQMFIKSYELQYNKHEILTIINDAYYAPNENALLTLYNENCQVLKSVYPKVAIISFQQLSLQFIPVSDVSFYIFDRRNQSFTGCFSLESSEGKIASTENEIVMMKNTYDLNSINQYGELAGDKPLYLVYDSTLDFFSYFQVAKFSEIIKNQKIKMFFSLVDFVKFFDGKENCLPQHLVNITSDDDYAKFVEFKTYVNSESNHEILVTPNVALKSKSVIDGAMKKTGWNKGTGKIVLSFCIPTYNRGRRALDNVKYILQLKNKDIEIIVCDNHSPDEDGKYRELSLLDDPRLKYYKNDENVGFAKNWLKAMEHAQGKYVYIISDEDFVNLTAIPKLLDMLRNEKQVAVLKGSMQPRYKDRPPRNCIKFDKDYLFARGQRALLNCTFSFNYISGAIYNRNLMLENNIFERVTCNIETHNAYPHLYLEALLCTVGSYQLLSDVICLEGEDDTVLDYEIFSQGVYSYEGRLTQHAAFVQTINEVFEMMHSNDDVQKVNLYLRCCNKTAYLIIRADGPYYTKIGRNLGVLADHAYYYCLKLAGDIFENTHLKNEVGRNLKLIFNSHKQ